MKVCDLPLMVGYSLSKRLSSNEGQTVGKEAFLQFWTSRQLLKASMVERIFHCFRQDGQEVSLNPYLSMEIQFNDYDHELLLPALNSSWSTLILIR